MGTKTNFLDPQQVPPFALDLRKMHVFGAVLGNPGRSCRWWMGLKTGLTCRRPAAGEKG